MSNLNRMSGIVKKAREGQMYGNYYYSYHIHHVHRLVRYHSWYLDNSEDYEIVAVGHDLIEDTEWTLDMLREESFSEEVVEAIDAITKRDGESRRDYLKRVKKNEIALLVKKWDTWTNLEHSVEDGNVKRIQKYTKQLSQLFNEDF